jgi:acyl-CoA synthetase (AMP-forming)/AMP-acid ligase II
MRLEVVFAAHAARNPDKEALVCGARRVSYRELKQRIREVAGGLVRLGVGAGDAIVLYLPNGVPFVELLYAAFSLGAKVVPVTTRNTIRELTYFCEDSAAKIVVCDDHSIAGVRSILAAVPGLKAITAGVPHDGFISYVDVSEGGFTLPSIPLDHDLAMILYTSGTTGARKACC